MTASPSNIRYLPYAFTEHGAIMAASVLNTHRAIDVSVYVVRAFVRLRKLLIANKELAGKLEELERKVASHDEAIRTLVAAIRQLMEPPPAPKRRPIGFHAGQEVAMTAGWSEPTDLPKSGGTTGSNPRNWPLLARFHVIC